MSVNDLKLTKESTLLGGESSYMPPEYDKKKQNNLFRGLGVGALAVATLVGGYFAVGSGKSNPNQQPVATALANSTETAIKTPAVVETSKPAAETLPTVESLEMDKSLISDPNKLAETLDTERSTAWMNAGATSENAEAAFNSDDIHVYAVEKAAEYDDIFISALLAPGWESNLTLSQWVSTMRDIHRFTIECYYKTRFSNYNAKDQVPYMRGSKLDKVVSFTNESDGTYKLVIIDHDYDNADKNRVGEELTNGQKVVGESSQPTITLKVDNGKIKMSNIILGK